MADPIPPPPPGWRQETWESLTDEERAQVLAASSGIDPTLVQEVRDQLAADAAGSSYVERWYVTPDGRLERYNGRTWVGDTPILTQMFPDDERFIQFAETREVPVQAGSGPQRMGVAMGRWMPIPGETLGTMTIDLFYDVRTQTPADVDDALNRILHPIPSQARELQDYAGTSMYGGGEGISLEQAQALGHPGFFDFSTPTLSWANQEPGVFENIRDGLWRHFDETMGLSDDFHMTEGEFGNMLNEIGQRIRGRTGQWPTFQQMLESPDLNMALYRRVLGFDQLPNFFVLTDDTDSSLGVVANLGLVDTEGNLNPFTDPMMPPPNYIYIPPLVEGGQGWIAPVIPEMIAPQGTLIIPEEGTTEGAGAVWRGNQQTIRNRPQFETNADPGLTGTESMLPEFQTGFDPSRGANDIPYLDPISAALQAFDPAGALERYTTSDANAVLTQANTTLGAGSRGSGSRSGARAELVFDRDEVIEYIRDRWRSLMLQEPGNSGGLADDFIRAAQGFHRQGGGQLDLETWLLNRMRGSARYRQLGYSNKPEHMSEDEYLNMYRGTVSQFGLAPSVERRELETGLRSGVGTQAYATRLSGIREVMSADPGRLSRQFGNTMAQLGPLGRG